MDESQGPSEQALALAERFRTLGERLAGRPAVKPPRRKDHPRIHVDPSQIPPPVYDQAAAQDQTSNPPPPADAPTKQDAGQTQATTKRDKHNGRDDCDFVTRSACELAEALNDFHSMKFYQQVVDDVRLGKRMTAVPRHIAFKQLFGKARELGELGKPERGVIRNPAAAFCAWWKKQS